MMLSSNDQQQAYDPNYLPQSNPNYPSPFQQQPPTIPDNNPRAGGVGVYSATYSGVPVFEMLTNGVSVMRRRQDAYLNATQILKVAGVEKGRRTKILEREVLTGEHEKVQGGYGKYQGTWIPYERGISLAKKYSVLAPLQPILDFDIPATGVKPEFNNRHFMDKTDIMKTELGAEARAVALQMRSAAKKKREEATLKKHKKNGTIPTDAPLKKKQKIITESKIPNQPFSNPLLRYDGTPINIPEDQFPDQYPHSTPHFTHTSSELDLHYPPIIIEQEFNPDRHKQTLTNIFVNPQNTIPDILTTSTPPPDFDINIIIDDQGHTATHWASALGKTAILALLVSKNANPLARNYMGETPLIRACMITTNYETHSFDSIVELLGKSIASVDAKNRTCLHHICLSAAANWRHPAWKYYMEQVMERIAGDGGDFQSIVNIQDNNGDTALNIAARIGDKGLVDLLVEVGSSLELGNKAGLRPIDFGFDGYIGGSQHEINQNEEDQLEAGRQYAGQEEFDQVEVGLRNDKVFPMQVIVDSPDGGVVCGSGDLGGLQFNFHGGNSNSASTSVNNSGRSSVDVSKSLSVAKNSQLELAKNGDSNRSGLLGVGLGVINPGSELFSGTSRYDGAAQKNYMGSLSYVAARVVFPSDNDEGVIIPPTETVNLLVAKKVEIARKVLSDQLMMNGLGREITESVQGHIDDLSNEFMYELRQKVDRLNEIQSSLRNIAKELAQTRKTNDILVTENKKIPTMIERINSLEKLLELTEFENQHQNINSNEQLITTSRESNQEWIKERTESSELLSKFRRIVSASAGIPIESVDEMIDPLLIALDSEQPTVNVSQLSVFMNKVRHQEDHQF